MRFVPCVLFILLSEAKSFNQNEDDDDVLPTALQKKVDVYPENFPEPVPFGHITLEGVGDPFSPHKQPVDFLELDMITPKNEKEARELLKKGKHNIQYIRPTASRGFLSPRDKYLDEIPIPEVKKNETQLKWFSLAEIQRRNAMKPPQIKKQAKAKKNPVPLREKLVRPIINDRSKFSKFARDMFQLRRQFTEIQQNWTSCDQFSVGAVFSPKHIVNLEWIPFYIWSLRGYSYAVVHKFVNPTRKIVTEYRMKYEKYMNKTIDWKQPKLLMTGMSEMLLIAADRKGLFDVITKHDIPESAKFQPILLPSISLRLKIEDPYLVMTICEDYYAMVMAISGNEPTNYLEMKEEAATIKFSGIGRVVWRDFEGEKERIRDEQERNKPEDESKYLRFEEPIPVIS